MLTEEKPAYVSLPLRITVDGKDHELRLLQKEVDRHTRNIGVQLDDEPYTLVNPGDGWRFERGEADPAFAQAIWHAIALRYRM